MTRQVTAISGVMGVVLVAEIVAQTGRLYICSYAVGPQAAVACQHPLGVLAGVGSRLHELMRLMSEPRRLDQVPSPVVPPMYQRGTQTHP